MGQKISVQQYRGPKGTILFIYGKSTAGKNFTGPQANREEGGKFFAFPNQTSNRSLGRQGKETCGPRGEKRPEKKAMNIECEAEKSSSARERRRGEHKLVPTCERFFPFFFLFLFNPPPLSRSIRGRPLRLSRFFVPPSRGLSSLLFFLQPTPFPLSSLSLSLSLSLFAPLDFFALLLFFFVPSEAARKKGERERDLLRCWRVIFFVWPPRHLKENQQNSFTTKNEK